MIRKTLSRTSFLLVIGGVVVLFIAATSFTMSVTSSTDYCMSCHEMVTYQVELDASPHAVDADNNPMECHQCHIPNSIGAKYVAVKVISGVKDQVVHTFGDPSNLDRRNLQDLARRFIQDDNCKSCHQDLFQSSTEEQISEIGRLAHEAYLGINGSTRKNCSGCHFNIAHLPDFDRRFPFNNKFSQNLPLSEE